MDADPPDNEATGGAPDRASVPDSATLLLRHKTADAMLLEFDLRDYETPLVKAVLEVSDLLDKEPPIRVYNRDCKMRRNLGFFGDPDETYGYFFSGQLAATKPLGPCNKALLDIVNGLFHESHNGVLVNEYEDGEHYISPHRDDELGLAPSGGVLCISYGAERTLVVKEYKGAKDAPMCAARTKSCHALLMAGKDFQKVYTHGVPKEAGAGRRISLTYRTHSKDREEKKYQAYVKAQSRKREREE
tara:strand:- start:515 stop:1249 length:735 start_codon:yes stop_codon:yes gene_type:complete